MVLGVAVGGVHCDIGGGGGGRKWEKEEAARSPGYLRVYEHGLDSVRCPYSCSYSFVGQLKLGLGMGLAWEAMAWEAMAS